MNAATDKNRNIEKVNITKSGLSKIKCNTVEIHQEQFNSIL
jgi:hypothetical protein